MSKLLIKSAQVVNARIIKALDALIGGERISIMNHYISLKKQV